MEYFGDRLRKKRIEKKLSQDGLADLMQKSGKTVISSWETGKAEPSISDLRKVAEILGVTPGWLLDGKGEGVSSVSEPPVGYTIVPTDEFIALQRKVIKQQEAELERQRN